MNRISWLLLSLTCTINAFAIDHFRDHLIVKGSIPSFKLLNDSVSIAFPMKNKLYLYNLNAKDITDTFDFKLIGPITCIDYCASKGMIAVGSQKGEVVLTDLKGHYQKLENLQNQIISLKFSNSGEDLAVATADNILQLWDTASHLMLWKNRGHDDNILTICFGPNDSIIYSGSADKRIAIWDKGKGVVLGYLDNLNSWVRKVTVSNEDRMLYAATDQGFIYNWSLTDHLPVFLKKSKSSGTWILSLLSNKNFIASGDQNGNVELKMKFGDYRLNFNDPVINLEYFETHDQIILLILVMNHGIYKMGISDDHVKYHPR